MGYDMRWRQEDASERLAVAAAMVPFNEACQERDAFPKEEKGKFDHIAFMAAQDAGEKPSMSDHKWATGRTERYASAQDKVHAASAALADAEKSYFRLNMWGMSRACDVMHQVGMMFDDEPHPAWPKPPDFGFADDDESVWAVKYPDDYPDAAATLTAEKRDAAERYLKAQDSVLAFHGKMDTPGIPDHKFSSNDGWLVVPVECEAAVRIWLAWQNETGIDEARNLVENVFGDYSYWNKWIVYIGGAARHGGFEVH